MLCCTGSSALDAHSGMSVLFQLSYHILSVGCTRIYSENRWINTFNTTQGKFIPKLEEILRQGCHLLNVQRIRHADPTKAQLPFKNDGVLYIWQEIPQAALAGIEVNLDEDLVQLPTEEHTTAITEARAGRHRRGSRRLSSCCLYLHILYASQYILSVYIDLMYQNY